MKLLRNQRRNTSVIRASVAIVVFVAVGVIAGLVFVDREAWLCSRKLTDALKSARNVELVEYAGEVEITRKTATADEVSRLRNATRYWWRPFVPTSGYLCFEAHHRIEIANSDGSVSSSSISFLCEQFLFEDQTPPVPLPSYLNKSLRAFFTSVGMEPKTHDKYVAFATLRQDAQTNDGKGNR